MDIFNTDDGFFRLGSIFDHNRPMEGPSRTYKRSDRYRIPANRANHPNITNRKERKKADREFQKYLYGLDKCKKIKPIAENTNKNLRREEKCEICGVKTKLSCSGCKKQWYCSKKCQIQDWKNHKEFCQKLEI